MGEPSILHRRGEDEGMEWCRGSQGERKEKMERGKIHREGIYCKECYNCASQFLT